MKPTAAFCIATLFAVLGDAALSPGCSSYLNSLDDPSSALSKCRVYTALGFPNLTHANDHDTAKLQKAISTYCATPACSSAQYAGVFKDLQTKCGADMVSANAATLGTVLYMWYLSPAQREAVCYTDAKNNSCVVNSVSEMIARAQFPDANPNEDDLYGYLQYVTPLTTVKGTNVTSLCTACNQQVANIFANYYTSNPSPFSLNFEQNLSSDVLKNDLLYQYKSNCNAGLGVSPTGAFKPTSVTDVSGGSGTGSSQNTPSFLGSNATNGAVGARYSMAGAVVAMAVMVAALSIL
ncbi:hypothetical protein CPC16_002238 [Podila verticillata]|nr:hypothetical protein BGZ52_004257 [Haplosporangium bisporale]KAF9203945.1 hypothetical protein BGZ59_001351 [Podila verticillata]KAF9372784.1 hypothetical protein CPC16_002238 [Podila verticillata]KFH67137.1 hypothetical protein MVEG_07660 [Podila verticillata NRRL 6337]